MFQQSAIMKLSCAACHLLVSELLWSRSGTASVSYATHGSAN